MVHLRPWIVVLLSGCAVSHGVRPLDRGEGRITASFGGPISADLPTPVALPVPITTVGYAHGLTDHTAIHAAIHPTGLATFGVFAMDAGVTGRLTDHDGAIPRIMIDGDLILATGGVPDTTAARGTRLFADLQAIASWDLGQHTLYGGMDQFLQPFPTPNYHVSPLVGGVLGIGRVDLQLEYMWLVANVDNALLAAEFIGPFGQGASSVKLGVGVHLGKGQP